MAISSRLIGLATLVVLAGATPSVAAQATTSPQPTEKNEHVQAGPRVAGAGRPTAQMPTTLAPSSRLRMQTAQATGGVAPFLTFPFVSWHWVTSIFDHCNPDYTQDGRVCRFDGAVGYKGNGVDPSFSLGYAQSPGGSDYLYYDGHNGWDYSMNYENVYSAAEGIVRLAGSDPFNSCFGQTVTIDHPNGFTTRYAHLSAIYVASGQSVNRGQVIAQSGNTGCSSGPHLHFGVYQTSSWTAVDPWGWWGAAGADPWAADAGDLWLTGTPQYPMPGVPGSVTAVAGSGSAVVSWTAPQFDGGMPITSYTITASPGGVTASIPAPATSGTVPGLTNGTTYSFTVTAVNTIGSGAPSGPSNSIIPEPYHGMYTINGFGGVYAAPDSPNLAISAAWPGWKIARSAALLPGGGGGEVLDGWGGLHPFGQAQAATPSAYWRGWDIARDLVLLPSTTSASPAGYVLDGWGGLHQFGSAPAAQVSAYWKGWDIARKLVLLSDGSGGYVLDGWGGLHPFAVGNNPFPPAIGNNAYWFGWDHARDVALLPGSTAANVAGMTLDGFGGVHPFGAAAAAPISASWSNWDIARSMRFAPTATAAHPQGWVMDGWGGLHPFGGASPVAVAGAYWPNQDIAVALAVQ